MVNITVEITNYGDIANFAERMGLLSFTTEIRKFMISMELQRPTNKKTVCPLLYPRETPYTTPLRYII